MNDELDDVCGMNELTMRSGQTALYIHRKVALFLSVTSTIIEMGSAKELK